MAGSIMRMLGVLTLGGSCTLGGRCVMVPSFRAEWGGVKFCVGPTGRSKNTTVGNKTTTVVELCDLCGLNFRATRA